MISKLLLQNYVKTMGNASFAGRLSGISEGHARKLLSGFSVDDALTRLKSMNLSINEKSSLFVPIADVHYGEVIQATPLNGNNSYDQTVAKDRILTIFNNIHNLVHDDIETIYIVNMGDMVNGHLHEENMLNDEMSPIKATSKISKILGEQIEFLAKEFPHVNIEVHSVLDNHSRTTRQRYFKNAADYSYSAVIASIMKASLKNVSNVEVFDAQEELLLNVSGTKWSLSHGDRSGGGSAAGAIKGQAMQRLQAMENNWLAVGEQPDFFMIAHFHMFAKVENYYICPCVCGPNEFSTYGLRLKPKSPKTLIFECAKGQILSEHLIHLDVLSSNFR